MAAVSDPIATRTLHIDGDPSRLVTVTIGRPVPDSDPRGDWMCQLDIQGIPDAGDEWVYGVDAVQAIELAFVGARQRLDRAGLVLAWSGQEPGETGFPKHVLYLFGRGLARKIEGYIEQEIEWFGEFVREHKARKP